MAIVSLREYAKHRCVSHTAVQKAIKSGRLADCLVQTPNGTRIDSEKADANWTPTHSKRAREARLCPLCGRPDLR